MAEDWIKMAVITIARPKAITATVAQNLIGNIYPMKRNQRCKKVSSSVVLPSRMGIPYELVRSGFDYMA
jgi:hypothetical protein